MDTTLQDLRFSMIPHNSSMIGSGGGRLTVCRMTLSRVSFYDTESALSWVQRGSAPVGRSGRSGQKKRSLST